MAGINVDDLRALPDYAPVFRWNLNFITLPSGLADAPSSEDINVRCETTEVPKATNQSIEVITRGHKIKQPGITDYTNTLTFTFVETVDNAIHNLLRSWQELVWETRSGNSVQRSELTGKILLQRLDNTNKAIWQYTIFDAYLEDHDMGTLDSSSEVMRPSMTVSFNFFESSSIG